MCVPIAKRNIQLWNKINLKTWVRFDMKTVFVVFLFAFTSVVIAAEEDELLIKDLEKSLMAPCCWSGTVADHGHEQMETEIRRISVSICS